MAELRVVVADDERLARDRLTRLLSGVDGVELVAACSSGAEVLELLETVRVDLLILDIQMPGETGLDVAELLGPEGPQVVFCTAHAEHAVRAFEQGVVDYLLKPVDRRRLALALERAGERLAPVPAAPAGKLALSTAKGVVLVATDSIRWCGIDGESVALHGERTWYTDLRLADLERRLPNNFHRLHRRALVNLDRVDLLESVDSGGYLAHLDDGSVVEVSRAAARRLRRHLLR